MTLMKLSASVTNKRLTNLAKPFRCNTYKNAGVARLWIDAGASPALPGELKCKPGEAPGLLINVVFGFKALQQRLQKGLGLVGCSADGLRHFLGGRREIPSVRRNPGERQMADP